MPYGSHVGPEQRADSARRSSAVRCDRLVGEDALQQQGVDVDQRGLQQVQRQHADFLAVAVRAGQFAVLAVEEGAVGGVPVLHHLQPVVDLAAQRRSERR